jgi:IS30 family transposase
MSRQRLPVSVESERPVTANQQKLVDLIMSTGMSVKECADELGRDASNCYRDLRKANVRKYLQERTLEHIGVLAPFAARTQQDLLNSESDHVRATVAENILDRHLGKPVMKQQVAFQGAINVSIDLS